jgi:hypothetical protein
MTKLDLLLQRIRKLPPEQQEVVAEEIDFILEGVEQPGSALTAVRWAEVRAALADKNEPTSSHEDVFARLETEDE